jgi:hypothetical protein
LFCWIDFAGGTLKQLLKDFEIALTTSERVRVLGVLIATRECIAAMSLYLDIMGEKELIDEQLKNTFVSLNKVG